MKWTQIRLETTQTDLEKVCAVMTAIDPGLMIEDTSDLKEGINAQYGELIDEELLRKDPGKAAVSIFVPEEKPLAEILAHLKVLLAAAGVPGEPELIGLNETDWAESWKKYYHPVRVGERLIIVPAWEEYRPSPGEAVVVMDPGMAFGSGTHETTRLCLRLLERFVRPGSVVADVGTGSGVLAIAAAKLGAGKVNCVDLDPVSVGVASRNIGENGLSDRVFASQSDLVASLPPVPGGYDLMTANIVADILLRMKESAAPFLRKGGILVLSGIIAPQREEVLSGYTQNGFSLVEEETENDWCAFALSKK